MLLVERTTSVNKSIKFHRPDVVCNHLEVAMVTEIDIIISTLHGRQAYDTNEYWSTNVNFINKLNVIAMKRVVASWMYYLHCTDERITNQLRQLVLRAVSHHRFLCGVRVSCRRALVISSSIWWSRLPVLYREIRLFPVVSAADVATAAVMRYLVSDADCLR